MNISFVIKFFDDKRTSSHPIEGELAVKCQVL